MKILFVPYHSGIISHIIPLLSLNRKLQDSSIETAFLLPKGCHHLISHFDANVLDIDHRGLSTEMLAYKKFSPHVVVDDFSLSTAYATALTDVPRVTVQRMCMFPGFAPSNKSHHHSMGLSSNEDIKHFVDGTLLGLQRPETLSDLFQAKIKIVPGIDLIEALPTGMKKDPTYVYSGPLLLDDYLLRSDKSIESDGFEKYRELDPIKKFFDAHKARKIVYITMGVVETDHLARAADVSSDLGGGGEAQRYFGVYDSDYFKTLESSAAQLHSCIKYLLDSGVAVITNIMVNDLTQTQLALYYHGHYLPMHFICFNIDLMIHQCGSGTYHYPIIHNVPAITVGTRCYDREDIAIRLHELGASAHLSAPGESVDFVSQFKKAVQILFDEGKILRQKEVLRHLKAKVDEVSSSFNFEHILQQASR